ncbi:SAICAR synthase-like protein, partial [Caulochytrium protostelioides]
MSASLPSSPVRSKTTFLDGGESGHQLGVNGHGGGPASGRTGGRRNNSDNVVLERRADHLGHRPKVEKEVLVGTPVKEGHVNYMLMYDMLTGIRISVSRCTAKPERELMGLDFKAAHKLAFDVTGNELTPSSKYDFKFKDYAPWVFRLIRQVYHVDPADYLLSLTGKYVLSELGSPGKSGSFFYYSQDYRFIIKTIHHSEHKFMMHILQRYYEHIKNNRETLLCRIFGLHRVKLPGNRKIHFVVMGNVFPSGKDIHESYDLKGSLVGRYIDAAEEEKNPRVTLKDMNWVGRQRKLQLGPQKRAAFVDQLEKDVSFLVSQKIMDYSLLIGCHDMSRGNRDNIRD